MKFEPTQEIVEEVEKELKNSYKQNGSSIKNENDTGFDTTHRIGEIALASAIKSILETDDHKWNNLPAKGIWMGDMLGPDY